MVRGYVPPTSAIALQQAALDVVRPDSDTARLCVTLRPYFVRGMAPLSLYEVLRAIDGDGQDACWERVTVRPFFFLAVLLESCTIEQHILYCVLLLLQIQPNAMQVYITVMKLLVEYMTGHFFDLYEAVNDFVQVLPGSPCREAERPAKLQWPMADKQLTLQGSVSDASV